MCPWYNMKESLAGVAFETYGGEEVKEVIENIFAKQPTDSIVKSAVLSQGKKNKNKWAWTVTANMDKSDKGIIQWYIDVMLAFYNAIEG